MIKVGIIGIGFVGNAMYNCLKKKGFEPYITLFGYDKYQKEIGTGKLEDLINCNIIFLALPTQYSKEIGEYDISSLHETCHILENFNYNGAIVIKSTINPSTTSILSNKYPSLSLIHNPEFLTARTAEDDFTNQKHIVIGKGLNCTDDNYTKVVIFYSKYFPKAHISLVDSLESETMKIFSNCFYAMKVQIFTEFYILCKRTKCDYSRVVELMINNGWINPMHTNVPGPDGKISYGGLCFPKDTNALIMYMKNNNSPCEVLQATINERNSMRNDNENCK
jgi:UDPglucose 6-dehydrogenase